VALLVVEAFLFAALSGELDRYWLRPLRRLEVRLTHPLGGTAGAFDAPLASTVQQLLRSRAYRSVGGLLRSDVSEHWDEGKWRFVSYTAMYDGQPATAVFAVPLLRYQPDAVQVAIVTRNGVRPCSSPSCYPSADGVHRRCGGAPQGQGG
jgi:hypothetical protein